MARALYICYFGLREPLVRTQVLPYLRELVKDGHEIILLTFEPDLAAKWNGAEIAAERERLIAEGIEWQFLPYHKRPSSLATGYDILRGTLKVRRLIGKREIDILHGRVHVPTLMGALARKLTRRKPKLLFDIRGFFPEEYTDAGIWPENGLLYRAAKRVERWLLGESDGFVVLTERAREILFPESSETGRDKLGRPVEIIPCCIDPVIYGSPKPDARCEMRRTLGVGDRRVIVYVGSFGGWYLSDEMLDFFAEAKRSDPETFVLVLTQRDKEKVIDSLRSRGFTDDEFFVDSVPPSRIPEYLAAGDVAVSFIKACYSKQSSSPTKIPEYLACGVPVIANRGVGDVDAFIERNRVGVMLADLSGGSYREALSAVGLLDGVRERCRETALREFDLEKVGGARYRSMYRRLLGDGGGPGSV